MGKKLSISQPTVINLELSPLSDTFWLDTNGEKLEQWYYENTGIYSPDRETTPLTITPKISVVDTLTSTKYTSVSISNASWYVLEYTENGWEEKEVEVSAPPSQLNVFMRRYPYVKCLNQLHVTKNNPSADKPITIRCVVTYIDPRDSGKMYNVESSVVLSTSVDAKVVYPQIQILSPKTTTFNPLESDSSIYTFSAIANWDGVPYEEGEVEGSERGEFEWYGVNDSGEELKVESFPYYVSGQGTDTLEVDAMYSENLQVVLRIKRHADDTKPLPPKANAIIAWSIPPIQGTIVSENGNALRGTSEKFSFYTIVSTNTGVVSEEKIKDNLRFQWKKRPATAKKTGATVSPSTETFVNLGWGERIEIKADDMMSFGGTRKSSSAMITNDIYLLGAYANLQYNGEDITLNDEKIYERTN